MNEQQRTAQRIIQAAQTVVMIYLRYQKTQTTEAMEMLDLVSNEMLRLLNNQIQFRNDWGDPVQLAYAIILTNEGYVPA